MASTGWMALTKASSTSMRGSARAVAMELLRLWSSVKIETMLSPAVFALSHSPALASGLTHGCSRATCSPLACDCARMLDVSAKLLPACAMEGADGCPIRLVMLCTDSGCGVEAFYTGCRMTCAILLASKWYIKSDRAVSITRRTDPKPRMPVGRVRLSRHRVATTARAQRVYRRLRRRSRPNQGLHAGRHGCSMDRFDTDGDAGCKGSHGGRSASRLIGRAPIAASESTVVSACSETGRRFRRRLGRARHFRCRLNRRRGPTC
eukprot:scaffold326353_cov55-Tisochrysis_lutea.AAC.9